MRKAILIAVLALHCGPSCEERGGKNVFSHYQPIVTCVKVPICTTYLMPIYNCVGAQK